MAALEIPSFLPSVTACVALFGSTIYASLSGLYPFWISSLTDAAGELAALGVPLLKSPSV